MKSSVYLDTTIFSYYVDQRNELLVHILRTKEWWDKERQLYDLYISNFILLELQEGKFPEQQQALNLTKNINILEPLDEIDKVVEIYIKNKLMPKHDLRDALHLAFASVYKIDFLLTWNCSHLANINKIGHIRNMNLSLGLFIPTIITPLELRIEE